MPTNTMNRIDAGLITLNLPVNSDSGTWHQIPFKGESAAYVDRQAAAYVIAYRDRVDIAIDENTDWSQFPTTFDALCANVPVYAVEYAQA
ncbi:hypothetical protein ACFCV3_32145 [Kribbella sp. NPDC056345]|uniref:hypothetical protein n=1 Tax=Kribbella sp. NPDC056345 TaxID=3345789 RepID=UPI0035DDA64E